MAIDDRRRQHDLSKLCPLMSLCGTPLVEGHFESISDLSRCLLRGSRPGRSAGDAAALICSALCAETADGDGDEDRAGSRVSDLTCVTLTLVDRLVSVQTELGASSQLCSYAEEVTVLLHQHTDLLSKMVQQFQAEDQIVSHLAAKSVSSYIFHQLQTSRVLHPVWQRKTVQAFHSPSPSADLQACMWSLTDVLKRLMKGHHEDLLMELLAAFDSSLSTLCSKLLSDDVQPVLDSSSSVHRGTTLCTLLDLLEVLTASRFTCGPAVCLPSQRLSHIHSSALLRMASSSSEYFVQKRVLLLTKRILLQKAGEDMALGEQKHGPLCDDVMVLADAVLQAVARGWLQCLHVESECFFGGVAQERGDEAQRPDCVMLRAVGLIVLKSVDLKLQTAGGTGEVSSREALVCVQTLWSFLRQCRVRLTETPHPCCWPGLLFGEQDDDMMEAAKALLSIFLRHRLNSGSRDADAACASGCNPHCHFLLLLRSVSFDHSTLLDFLISTETCFLEYFVRYLKYVGSDWQGFTRACQRTDESEGEQGPKFRLSGFSVRPAPVPQAAEEIRPASGIRLVDYGSSDESDTENIDVSDDSRNNREPNSKQTQRPSSQTSARVVSCLSQLRQVVTRLQTKKLFPYNASSLLKLLAQVETLQCCHH
ncbi:protein Lines homolog 1 isoform X2 [Genypterus blacodes]|uniref:protein Lines homolog 1 isoform X2 n=1 Tax=Genypterus blacodes TaxID=154954 RepID=UPI003F75CD9B